MAAAFPVQEKDVRCRRCNQTWPHLYLEEMKVLLRAMKEMKVKDTQKQLRCGKCKVLVYDEPNSPTDSVDPEPELDFDIDYIFMHRMTSRNPPLRPLFPPEQPRSAFENKVLRESRDEQRHHILNQWTDRIFMEGLEESWQVEQIMNNITGFQSVPCSDSESETEGSIGRTEEDCQQSLTLNTNTVDISLEEMELDTSESKVSSETLMGNRGMELEVSVMASDRTMISDSPVIEVSDSIDGNPMIGTASDTIVHSEDEPQRNLCPSLQCLLRLLNRLGWTAKKKNIPCSCIFCRFSKKVS